MNLFYTYVYIEHISYRAVPHVALVGCVRLNFWPFHSGQNTDCYSWAHRFVYRLKVHAICLFYVSMRPCESQSWIGWSRARQVNILENLLIWR